jgi:hypothetical protein
MIEVTLDFLTEQLELGEQLLAGRNRMFEPQDLPGRYGRVVQAVQHVLSAIDCEAVVAGGWAVWRHGYLGRITQDLDIVLPSQQVEEFLRAASVSGFEILPIPEGRWPKMRHKPTDVQVDVLPEGAYPGTASRPAPTAIPHPAKLGGQKATLNYIDLPGLVELKLAAGRGRDEADVIELLRVHPERADELRQHLAGVHSDYVELFDRLLQRAREQEDS